MKRSYWNFLGKCQRLKRLRMPPADFMSSLAGGEIDFIDAGCGTGGSLAYCKKIFGLPNGIGFDLNEQKILEARSKGYNAHLCDILSIDLPHKCVSYASMMDFLEHLPSIDLAERMLHILGRSSMDFLFIRHPNFDDNDYLRKLNLKLAWTDWTGHPNMMKISDFEDIFEKFNWNDYRIIPRKPIEDSNHEVVLPLDAPENLHKFSQLKGFHKPFVKFAKPVYTQYDIFVKINGDMRQQKWDEITSKTSVEGGPGIL